MRKSTDPNSLHDEVIALAGVAQSSGLIQQVATCGTCDNHLLQTMLDTLFSFDPLSVADVYGGVAGVAQGFPILDRFLAGAKRSDSAVNYFLAMLHLQRLFAADADMMQKVRARLEHTQLQSQHFADSTDSVCRGIDGIYQDTLSTLRFRVKVQGDEKHLGNPRNAAIVRSLLLAGVRSAMLWRQSGGSRWNLLLKRKPLQRQCRELISTTDSINNDGL